jgi:lamin tail-like protein/carbohydrate binding protein with CBM4/9 domain
MANIYSNPTFLRMYWRALGELVNGPLNTANSGSLLDAKYNVFVANQISVENPNSVIIPWVSQAQSSIASQLAAVNATSFTVNSTQASNNVAYVNGTAPVNVQTIWINGSEYPLIWTSLTNWTARVPLNPGTNQLNVVGENDSGQPIAGDNIGTNVTYNGTNPSPVGQVVINEIMYDPAIANAQFVELYNNSTNTAFDLSGWQLQGLNYTFPNGSILGPTNYLVLAANRASFAAAYGATNPVFDTFSGTLQPGQILSLVQPGGNGTNNLTVAEVQYDSSLPWPTNTIGSSLQLIDPNQDNWRVGNWAMVTTNTSVTPQWTYVTATGTASSSMLYIYLQSAGDVYVDDIKIVAGSVPEAGANVLSDGDFESGFPGSWTVSTNLTNSVLSTTVKHSGNASLHVISTSAGTTQSSAIWQTISPSLISGAAYTLSFWYLQNTNGGPLTIRLSGSGITTAVNPPPPANAIASVTPDAINSVATSLTPFPPLWINELQADNLTGITNSAGQRTGWLELYNPSTNVVSLNGLYLADNYTNLTQWAFPTNAMINPGQFKVIFADGETNLSTTNELHTGFVLPSGAGSLALTRLAINSQLQVLDYVNYTNLSTDHSYGSFPDGQSFIRQDFYYPTPGGMNNGSGVQPPSFILYNAPGMIYSQNFDALPDPGATSVNANNPVTINGITYSLADPFDFAFPSAATGNGGLGLSAMTGWYGYGVNTSQFGATDGDQTTGGDISFGLTNGYNRALGLLATSSTAGTGFGVKFINATGTNLNYINLNFVGEVWRQSDTAKTLQFYYFIDPTATVVWPTNSTAFLPALNVNFKTIKADKGGVPVDGTAVVNQTNLSVLNQVITNWPPGSALWLVWQMTDNTGKAQGLAIDNLNFSATTQPVTMLPAISIQVSGGNLMLNWPSTVGLNYQIQYKDDLTAPTWTPLGSPLAGTGAFISVTNNFTSSAQRFYRILVQ